jgi:hypothetical protein
MADSLLKAIDRQVTKSLQAKLDRTKLMSGFLNRVIYPMYQNAQRMRWASFNATEGSLWASLDSKYAKRKLIKFASFPGGGRKMMIAKGRLFNSVTGDSLEDHRKIITDNSIEVLTTVEYAGFVDEKRPFLKLSDKTLNEMKQAARDYLMAGKE